jgi:hypothetical protein
LGGGRGGGGGCGAGVEKRKPPREWGGFEGARARCSASSGGDILNTEDAPTVVPAVVPVAETEAPLVANPVEVHDDATAEHLRG